ncbi:MAG: alginate lyase family protein [Acidobacteria bacterium]|nr:alginate lyase family protein [Acidobacteriota bacterium]
MVEALKKLKKLRGRSFDELRVRGRQAIASLAERRGLSAQARVPADAAFFKLLDSTQFHNVTFSAESLLNHFRTRTSPAFFASFINREETITELKNRFAGRAGEALIARADRILEGRFDLLGLSRLDFGEPVDWHLEPISAKRLPLKHWSAINFLDAGVAGDKKIIWELNRHQYFMTLGRAYWLTGDERYAQKFVTHIRAWMESNPPKLGVNWASSLEVSLRVIAWLWAIYFFKDSPSLKADDFLRVQKFLYLHGRHLETYLSTYFSPNTHLTGEALGLFYLGTLLPEFRRAGVWRATGKRILLDEIERHVKPDGVYFEHSSYYHRYTTDFYTHFLLLSQANNERLPVLVEDKLTGLLDHLMYITRPDGTTPFFGDDDGGRLVMLDERPANDFRAALSNGAALFGRADYKHVAEEAAEETLWLTGSNGLQKFDRLDARPPAHASRGFVGGGYYVMRDCWTKDADYLLIDGGEHGTSRLNYGHAHADALAFELAVRGSTLLVDPGTYTYTGSSEMRDYFRSTAAHNTMTIDGESSSVPDGAFNWKQVAHTGTRAWMSHKRADFFEGFTDGYARLSAPAKHSRGLLFLKGDYWIIRDHVETAGAHQYDLRFHFTPDARPAIENVAGIAAVHEQGQNRPGLELFTFGGCGEWRKEDGRVSFCYGESKSAPVYVFTAMAEGEQEFITFMLPRASAQAPKSGAREIEAVNGRAFEVLNEERRDCLLLGRGRMAETAQLSSDFDWLWARYTRDGTELLEVVAIGGRHLSITGREVVSATNPVGYLAARRVDDEWQVETDAAENLSIELPGAGRIIVGGKSLTAAAGSTEQSEKYAFSIE